MTQLHITIISYEEQELTVFGPFHCHHILLIVLSLLWTLINTRIVILIPYDFLLAASSHYLLRVYEDGEAPTAFVCPTFHAETLS